MDHEKKETAAHEKAETKKEERQEEVVEKANKAKGMLYKETGKKCGLSKESAAILKGGLAATDLAKRQAKRSSAQSAGKGLAGKKVGDGSAGQLLRNGLLVGGAGTAAVLANG